MTRAVLLVLLFCALSTVYGQGKKQSIFQTQITTQKGMKVDGYLTFLGDSTLQLARHSILKNGSLNPDHKMFAYAVNDVYLIRIRKKGVVGRGMLIGCGTGILIGSIIGYMVYNSSSFQVFDQTDSGLIGGVMGATVGAGLGALAGGSKRKIFIYGDQEIYNQQRQNLEPFVLKTSVKQ